MKTRLYSLTLGVLLLVLPTPVRAEDAEPDEAHPLAEARQLMLTGKYAEAIEQFEKLVKKQPLAAALGIARCYEETGKLDEAAAALERAAKEHPKASRPLAALARLAQTRGNLDAAGKSAEAAIKLDENDPAARWVQAEVFRLRGKLPEANRAYEWLVNYYNREDIADAESLHYVGLGAAQFARWNRITDQFSFLVNELYPDVVRLEKNFWPAHYEAGRLFMEKYNQADAQRELKRALKINPNAAEVHAALAALAVQGYDLSLAQTHVDQALVTNPKLLAARLVEVDIHLANFDAQRAAEVLKGALELNPRSEEALGRLAGAWLTLDGTTKTGTGTRVGKLMAEVNARNPHAGAFYLALADALDKTRRFPAAALYYQQAVERMPQLTEARGQWGLMLMRLGDEAQAKKVFDEAFDIDPFNLRVSNQIKVLGVLDGYKTLETDHFLIKYDDKKDRILARYAARWLEEIYPQLCQELGYEPPQKSLFEIFNKAKNTDGHGWFSARMVGLPHIHTIGACAGKIVAMQSPTEGRKFNWARVLRHEFVHVLNLQQTDFNIPHWFTEALAVLNEGYPRPAEWNQLLAQRLAAGKVFNLDSINSGFIRPQQSSDWTLAYCQAALYAEYMKQRFGPDALRKILAAYSNNLSTTEAIQRSFNVELPDFEKGYTEFLKKLVAETAASGGAPAQEPKTLAELQKALSADPKNPDLLAQTAKAHLDRRAYSKARGLVDEALQLKPKHALASYVRARLHLVVGENQQGLEVAEAALDRNAPQSDLLSLLAGLRLKAEKHAEAAELYELGAKHFPGDVNWIKSLASVYVKSGDQAKLAPILGKLADLDYDDVVVRKKLATMALAAKDYPTAVQRAREALHIDVMDVEVHRLLGEALAGAGDPKGAAEEFAVAIELKPSDAKLHFALAEAQLAAGQKDQARGSLETVRRLDPKHPGLEALAEKLKQ
jgi:tetratricopeptide (TPR) repeat protein